MAAPGDAVPDPAAKDAAVISEKLPSAEIYTVTVLVMSLTIIYFWNKLFGQAKVNKSAKKMTALKLLMVAQAASVGALGTDLVLQQENPAEATMEAPVLHIVPTTMICGAVYGLTKDWRLLGLHTYMSMAAAFVTAFMVQVVLLQYQMALHNPDIHVLLIYLVSMLAVCWEDVDTWLLSKYRQRGRCAIPAGSPPIKSSSSNRAIRFTSAPIVSAESGDVGVAASKSGLNKESATTINTESSSSLRTLPSDESVESRSSEEVCHRHNR